jgi:hypothetical protein
VSQILEKGVSAVLEEWIFSDKANVTAVDGKQPFMLSRFLDSLVHPVSTRDCGKTEYLLTDHNHA